MKRVKKLQEKGFYILEAKNAANTHFIENEREVDQFLIFANSHFREFGETKIEQPWTWDQNGL